MIGVQWGAAKKQMRTLGLRLLMIGLDKNNDFKLTYKVD